MNEEGKKISFGFSKLTKKTSILGIKKVKEEEKVQFIDCVEEKSIKVKNDDKKEEKVLIIPLNDKVPEENCSATKNNIGLKKNDRITKHTSISESFSQTECSPLETLDSLAAKEILEEVNNRATVEENPKIFAVPLTSNAPLGEKESSLEDYESIPISEYGLAMLRGMGWSPGKGVGKNSKLITSSAPVLRPKGMGLGADKCIKTLPNLSSNNQNEELKLIKGAFVRVIAGTHKDLYGQVEGFDEESGRLFVKLPLKNTVISFNEFMVQLVNKHDFTKNSKVINVRKFEEYKNKEEKIDEHLNSSPSTKNNIYDSNPGLQEISSSKEIKDNDNHDKHFLKKSSKKHTTKSNRSRNRSSSYDSPPRKYSQYRKYDSSSVNKISNKDQTSSDESPPSRKKKHSQNNVHSSSRSKTLYKDQSSSDESPSPPRQRRNHSQSKDIGSSREKKLYRGNSPLKERRKRSQSRETSSNSRLKNYNSSRDRKNKSSSRSPRRKHK